MHSGTLVLKVKWDLGTKPQVNLVSSYVAEGNVLGFRYSEKLLYSGVPKTASYEYFNTHPEGKSRYTFKARPQLLMDAVCTETSTAGIKLQVNLAFSS